MKKFRVSIARSLREYANPIVQAPSIEVAEAYLTKQIKGGGGADIPDTVSWEIDGDPFDEEVIGADEHEDDEEPDVIVPADFQAPPAAPEAPADGPAYGELSWCADDVRSLRADLSYEEAEAFLQRNERYLRDRLCELGFECLSTYLSMDDELPPRLQVGNRVFWTDPDPDTQEFSRWGTIAAIGVDEDENIQEDTIIFLKMDDEAEVEALPGELSRTEPTR